MHSINPDQLSDLTALQELNSCECFPGLRVHGALRWCSSAFTDTCLTLGASTCKVCVRLTSGNGEEHLIGFAVCCLLVCLERTLEPQLSVAYLLECGYFFSPSARDELTHKITHPRRLLKHITRLGGEHVR